MGRGGEGGEGDRARGGRSKGAWAKLEEMMQGATLIHTLCIWYGYWEALDNRRACLFHESIRAHSSTIQNTPTTMASSAEQPTILRIKRRRRDDHEALDALG